MKAWIPSRCSVGARFSRTGWSLMTSSSTSHTSGRTRSTMRLALLMLCAKPFSTSCRMTNGLNSSSAIFFGRPHWCSFSSGPTTITERPGVVDALAEQVLAEPALLALEHVGQALEPMVAGARDGAAAAAVVDQRVARLLQHPLLVADDDLGRLEVEEPAEAVVAVDDAAIQVVEVGRGEAAAVELHHRAQVGRNHRQRRQDHPLRARAGLAEGLDQAQALDRLLAALARRLAHLHVEVLAQLVEVDALDDLLDRLGAHAGVEHAAVHLRQVAVLALGQDLHDLDVGEPGLLGPGPQLRVVGLAG